jgi:MFS family permease
MTGRVRGLVPALWRYHPDFTSFLFGQTISLFGDQISLLAIPLVGVLLLHANAAQMGYLAAAGLAPNLLFALHAGALVDRLGRRRQMMIGADLGRAVLLVTVPVMGALGLLSFGYLYAVAFLAGTLSVLFSVSYSTLFVSVVPRERYVQASSMLNGSRALSFVGGPSVGGLLVQFLTAPVALVADAVSFVASAVSLLRIRPEEPPREEGSRGLVTSGLRFIFRTPIMRAALGATATINFFNFVFFAIFILYATRALHLQPATLGLVLGVGAVGGVIGSVIAGHVSRRIGIGPMFMLGCIVFPAPMVLIPLASGPQVVVLAMLATAQFGIGLGVMLLDIGGAAIFAALIPHQLRARVSGAYLLVNYGVRPLGSLVGGALGTAVGLRETLFIATICGVAGFLWLLPSPIPRLRTLPEPAEA